MKKIILFLTLSLVLLGSAVAIIGSVYPYEVDSGETNTLIVTMFNHDDSSVREAQISVYVPYLGVYGKSRGFRIDDRESARAVIQADFPQVSGYYPVIVTLTDEDGQRERTHRWIYVN